jgi:UDP-N-acetyl-D-glucosamine dehydrogenase
MLKVTVVGQGYVGLPLAIKLAEFGNSVIGLDTDKSKVLNLLQGITPMADLDSENLKDLITNEKYTPSSDPTSMKDSDVFVIAVPTPLSQKKEPDLTQLEAAAKMIAENCRPGSLVINESTSYPGTLRNIIKPIFEKYSIGQHYFASAPERMDPSNNLWDLSNTPRIISGLNETATQRTFDFYSLFCDEVYIVSTPEVAEAAKLFENSFRQVNIALVNEFSMISSVLGFSTNEAIQAASTKPFGFMPFFPSIGVGGHCIPIDPSYLSYAAKKVGVKANLIELATTTNLNMVKYVVDKIIKILGKSLSNLDIQVAGIAYKPGVSDLRESPAIDLIYELRSHGAKVSWHDPLVKTWQGEDSVQISDHIDLGLIVTPHEEISFSVWKSGNTKVLDLSANSKDYGWPKFL